MSRVGKLPVEIPAGVTVNVAGLMVTVEGPKGKLENQFKGDIDIVQKDNTVLVTPKNDQKHSRAMWGTARSIINNMVNGVATGFKQELEVKGVGYRASVKGKFLGLILGKSHNTMISIPPEVKVNVPKQDVIELESADKEKLGQFVALIKSQRPPEPYKGKGIKIKGEYIIRKEGKKG